MATYTTHQDFSGTTVSFGAEDLFTGIANSASGGAITAVSSANVTITGSTFSGNSTEIKGGALYMQYAFTTVTIDGALFENNFASPGENGGYAGGAIQSTVQNTSYTSLTVNGSTFTANSVGANCKGGAMDLWGMNLSTNNIFTGNTATFGGAINDYQIFTDIGSTFTNNVAVTGGAFSQTNAGGWSAPGSTFTNTKFTSNTAGVGGAFYGAATGVSGTSTFYTNFQMNEVEFTGNTATTAGGAITNNSQYGNITDSIFSNNVATGLGGAILNNGTITITNTEFTGNYSETKGGGAIHNSGSLFINGGSFDNNLTKGGNAVSYGGAISNDGTAFIEGVDFIGNTANGAGGALHIASSAWTRGPNATITNCLFEDNVSVVGYDGGYGGGAIFDNEHNEDYTSLTVTDSIFRGNQALAGKGGAMDMWGGVISENNLFENNTALLGGAIDIYQIFNDTGSTFTHNSAPNGGAISLTNAGNWSNPTVTLTNTIITENTAVVTEDANGKVTNGAGAGIYSVYQLTVNGGTISNNYTRGNGGGVNQANGTATFNGVLIDSNTSAYGTPGSDKGGGHGGGLSMNGTVIVNDTTFINNLCDGYYGGGGMYINASGSGTVTNSLFTGNRGYTGAGMASIWASYTVSGSTFTGNSATNWGGGISKWAGSSTASTASIVDSVITGNSAGAAGGGLYGKNFIITRTLVDGNTSGGTGGGYSMNTHDGWGYAIITDSTFSNNQANGSGGAIMAPGYYATKVVEVDGQTQTVQNLDANNTLVITGTLFRNNTGTTGGAIYSGNGERPLVYATITDSVFDANTATNDPYGGGALYLNSFGSTQTVNNSTFTNNIAAGAGGAITNLRGLTEVNNSLFEGNTSNGAGYSGGAISEFGMGTVSISNSTFSNNVGKVAGAIDATSVNSPSTVIVKDTLFTGNTAAIGAIKTRGAYNYLENVTFETITDAVNIETAKSITLKGDIVANSSISLSGCDITVDGLNITFGYTGGETAAWFGNSFVTAEGAATGLESVTFANIGNVYFAGANGQDLTNIDVNIVTDAYATVGTYTVASGISGIDNGVNILKGISVTTTPFDTPYVLDDTTLAQMVSFGGGVLTVKTADTLYIGVDAADANGFDMFETQADLEAVYGTDFTGTVVNYEPQAQVFVNEAWTAASVPPSITVDGNTTNLTWNLNAFNNTTAALNFLEEGGKIFIENGLAADTTYITNEVPTYFLGGNLSNVDIRGCAVGGTVTTVDIIFDGVTSSREHDFFGKQSQETPVIEGNATVAIKNSTLTSQYMYPVNGLIGGDYNISINDSSLGGPYVAGEAQVTGTIGVDVDGSQFTGNLSLTAQGAAVKIADSVTMVISNSTLGKQLRGTGSSDGFIDGNVSLYLENTTVAKEIYGSYGNYVKGDLQITLDSSTAGSVVADRKGHIEGFKMLSVNGGTSTIGGIDGFDELLINSNAELNLTYTGGLLSDMYIYREGTLNGSATMTNAKWTYKDLAALNGIDTLGGLALTINGTAITDLSGNVSLNNGNQTVVAKHGNIVIEAVASYVNGNDTMDSLVSQTRTNYVKFDTSSATATMTTRTLDRDMKFEGNGTSATTVTAGALYAGGNSLALKDITWTGSIYGGVKDGEVAAVELDLENVNLTKDLYGAGVAATSDLTVTGDVVATLTSVAGDKSYYGAGYANGGDITVDGAVKTTIDGGSYKNIYNGANMSANATGKSTTLGGAELTIYDGEFSGIVGNGGFVRASQSSLQGDSSLTIMGGTFNSYVYGGAFAYGTGSKSTAISAGTATVEGDINVTISGGIFNADVFGGSLASNSHIATANTSVTGDITITLDATNAITLNGSVIAGSLGKGTVTGNTAIVVTGMGSNLNFGTDSCVTGTSEYGTNINSYVSGARTLAFDSFTGAFGAQIANGAFDTFEFSADSSVELASALDLTGNALNITGTFTDDATLLTDVTGLIWNDSTTVTLFGEVAAAVNNGIWESDNYRLTADAMQGTLAVSMV